MYSLSKAGDRLNYTECGTFCQQCLVFKDRGLSWQWSLNTGLAVIVWVMDSITEAVLFAVFPDTSVSQLSYLVATGGFDNTVRLWDFLATAGSPSKYSDACTCNCL